MGGEIELSQHYVSMILIAQFLHMRGHWGLDYTHNK